MRYIPASTMRTDQENSPSAALVEPDRRSWNRHWRGLDREASAFGRLASLVRRNILARAVRHYAELYFPASGTLVEVGCGSGEASTAIRRAGRRLVGCDYSMAALAAVDRRTYDSRVLAEAAHLPFRDGTVDGIWNLGVMEHFLPATAEKILLEFSRVLARGRRVVMFWPPAFGSSRLVLAPIEWATSLVRRRTFRFFPDEVNRLASRRAATGLIAGAGLRPVAAHFNATDAFIHVVVVAERPA